MHGYWNDCEAAVEARPGTTGYMNGDRGEGLTYPGFGGGWLGGSRMQAPSHSKMNSSPATCELVKKVR